MIGLDCNILVQLAVADHPANARTLAVVESNAPQGKKLVFPSLVATEFLHVVTDERRFALPLDTGSWKILNAELHRWRKINESPENRSRLLFDHFSLAFVDENGDHGLAAANAQGRAGFDVANSARIAHSCPMKITEDVLEYATEQSIAEEEALKNGMEEKSREFTDKGREIHAKT
jgi:predicted nucleic acid-binding protein